MHGKDKRGCCKTRIVLRARSGGARKQASGGGSRQRKSCTKPCTECCMPWRRTPMQTLLRAVLECPSQLQLQEPPSPSAPPCLGSRTGKRSTTAPSMLTRPRSDWLRVLWTSSRQGRWRHFSDKGRANRRRSPMPALLKIACDEGKAAASAAYPPPKASGPIKARVTLINQRPTNEPVRAKLLYVFPRRSRK